jgi:hypothetical protein
MQQICQNSHIYSALENALKTQSVSEILMLGIEITNEIVAEVLCSHNELLEEIALHDVQHKAVLVKKIVFSFITIKGKHICRTFNIEQNSLIRHHNTKTVLFKHE